MSVARQRRMRPPLTALLIAMTMAAAVYLGEMIYGYRIALMAAGNVAFAPAFPVVLRDSLPVLGSGLSDLEAFTMALSPHGRADALRVTWWAPGADSLVVEFYTERKRLDSTQLVVWSDVSGLRIRNLHATRHARWSLPLTETVNGWEEIVGVYVSRPRSFPFRSADPATGVFERVEGRVLHRVRGAYRARRPAPIAPDTAYPAPKSGELELWARGDAVAVVNPGDHEARLGLIPAKDGRRAILHVPAGMLHVYRTLLRNSRGPVLAYENPGRPRSLLFRTSREDAFFWLDRP